MASEYVPEDILCKILANLPVKPLLQFKCVSKHWNRLISDPSFRSRSMILLPGKRNFRPHKPTPHPSDNKVNLAADL
ncbi:F-box domain-containing protein [Artemisia annua]|uniref:F-box domain-containing protein n=1 Tax=Artemisia annua TaxID=35608 RepID=A0A2U1L4U0_ARTAN|nr:F-box domain-containing protein [Artemisia annua]